MCCGQKREQMKAGQAAAGREARAAVSSAQAQAERMRPFAAGLRQPAPEIPGAGGGAGAAGTVVVKYVETSPVRVYGPATGKRYEFSGAAAVQAVDVLDAPHLVKTGFFRRA